MKSICGSDCCEACPKKRIAAAVRRQADIPSVVFASQQNAFRIQVLMPIRI